jgi:hypothetical protein
MKHRKRALLAAAAGLALFSIVFAVAASLNVSSATLGAGTATVASCDTDGVTASYDTAYSVSPIGYKVTTVHVAGIATPACDGKAMRVSLVGAGDALLAEQTMTLGTPAADPSNLTFTGDNVLASLVLKVSVVIAG